MFTAPPAIPKVPVAFMSYAHHDDGDSRLSRFHERLERELRSQTGIDLEIFKDNDDIGLGEQWRKRLEAGLAGSTFLLPIVTPSFLTSPYCREELEAFLRHERALGRDDLILPIYYIDCRDFESAPPDDPAGAALRELLDRQRADWRDLRTLSPSSPRVEQARVKLAGQIRAAMTRVVEPRREARPDEPSRDEPRRASRRRAAATRRPSGRPGRRSTPYPRAACASTSGGATRAPGSSRRPGSS